MSVLQTVIVLIPGIVAGRSAEPRESLHYVKEQMGHASIQTTVDVYGHLVPGSNRNAVNRLDNPAEPNLRVIATA